MRQDGELEHGQYIDDCADVDVKDILAYYGRDGAERPLAENPPSGAGHTADDEDMPVITELTSDVDVDPAWEDLDGIVEGDGDPNFHLTPIYVPKHVAPFANPEAFQLFEQTLSEANGQDLVPGGMELRREEWVDGAYPSHEIIKGGRKGKREMRIDLPVHVWLPRAERWGRALYVLNFVSNLYRA
ncbi:hypothetical protein K523DRAFT_251351 [Schizophyllum commune Tattone D]|nr:hypothetical protein K523DRAFT_251351 [Schizophyllum commune Tattone D]